jgi:hypothetical protein
MSYEIHLEGFEPSTFGSVDRCSIQLSYRCASWVNRYQLLAILPNCFHFYGFPFALGRAIIALRAIIDDET